MVLIPRPGDYFHSCTEPGAQFLLRVSRSSATFGIVENDTLRILPIRESVNSLYRDGRHSIYMRYLSKSHAAETTNMLKVYLSIQTSSLWSFVIRNNHTVST